MSKKVFTGKGFYVYLGYTRFKSFGLGFHIDKYSANIDLGVFWIAAEW